MVVLEKINPHKYLSLVLFYVAMALSIVYFDLFQTIENNRKDGPEVEKLELVIQQNPIGSHQDFKVSIDQITPQKILETIEQNNLHFEKRLFHENRNIDHQFKEGSNKQLRVNYKSHQQFALIISHQKMEEEAFKSLV